MENVPQVYQSRCGYKDYLQHPEPDVRYGESDVIAYVLATGLLGVAGEARLLVAPHLLCRSTQDQDAEDEQDSEPHLPHDSGVLLGFFQELSQQVPIPHGCERSDLGLQRI